MFLPVEDNNIAPISGSIDNIEGVEEYPDSYFPNFLYYSIEVANAMIDFLYDEEFGGFYRLTDQHWDNSTTVKQKFTYDQAQSIQAMLKLSEAVINTSQRDYALEIAEKTATNMISNLYDQEYQGFFISSENTYKKPGINGKAIQSLISLYNSTNNASYLTKAIEAYDFLEDRGWDDQNKGYYYILSHSGYIAWSNPDSEDPYEPEAKRTDHNVIMGEAVLDLYSATSEAKYLSKAIEIYNSINGSSRNIETGLFYTGTNEEGEIVVPEISDVFVNSLVLEYLSKLYQITGEIKYSTDFFSLLNKVLFYFWDNTNGGFMASYSYDKDITRDEKKYSERQFYALRALDEAFKLSNNEFYYNLILDLVEYLNNKLYDNTHKGYFLLTNRDGNDGETFWKDKYAVTQSLAIFELASLWIYSKPGVVNALWSPIKPRPEDSVTIMIAAFDTDGIADVMLNYSLNNQPYELVDMDPSEIVGNMYQYTLDPNPHGSTLNFNIIVNDTLGNKVIRESYFLTWIYDEEPPHVMVLGVAPANEVYLDTNFSITVSAVDRPSQGTVNNVRIHYRIMGSSARESRALTQLDKNIWKIEFPSGFDKPNTYEYYFEAIDSRGNYGYTSTFNLVITGPPVTTMFGTVIAGLVIIFLVVPGILYTYYEKRKKGARQILKDERSVRIKTRGRASLSKRGTKRV
jgi:mannose/cellobiose epimerase-like protein (N-acyl-D-glucosamine 2-epimerase family)